MVDSVSCFRSVDFFLLSFASRRRSTSIEEFRLIFIVMWGGKEYRVNCLNCGMVMRLIYKVGSGL